MSYTFGYLLESSSVLEKFENAWNRESAIRGTGSTSVTPRLLIEGLSLRSSCPFLAAKLPNSPDSHCSHGSKQLNSSTGCFIKRITCKPTHHVPADQEEIEHGQVKRKTCLAGASAGEHIYAYTIVLDEDGGPNRGVTRFGPSPARHVFRFAHTILQITQTLPTLNLHYPKVYDPTSPRIRRTVF